MPVKDAEQLWAGRSQVLLAEAEALRRALVEVDELRATVETALRRESALLSVLNALSKAQSPGAGLVNLLKAVSRSAAGTAATLIEGTENGAYRIVAASRDDLLGVSWEGPAELVSRPRRVPDMARSQWMPLSLHVNGALRSLMVVPIRIVHPCSLALACFAEEKSAFSVADLALLERIAEVAVEPLENLRLARRSALLAALVEGRDPKLEVEPSVIDVPFESINRAYVRLTHAQAVTVDLVSKLLSASEESCDDAIREALSLIGHDYGSDCCVLYVRDPAKGELVAHEAWTRSKGQEARVPQTLDIVPAQSGETRQVLAHGGLLFVLPVQGEGASCAALGLVFKDKSQDLLPGEANLLRFAVQAMHSILLRAEAERESRKASHELRLQRNRLAATVSALPDLLLDIDSSGRIHSCHSAGWPAFRGFTDQLTGRMMTEVFPAAALRKLQHLLFRVGQNEIPPSLEINLSEVGGPACVLAQATPLEALQGTGALLVLRDVTFERKQAEEIALLSEVARRTTNLVVVTDPERRITWVNDAFERATGWSLAEARGHDPGELLQSERTDRTTLAAISKALAKGEPVQAELLNRTRSGDDYWLHLDIQPRHDSSGAVAGFMAVETDISVIKAQEEALQIAAAEAEQARARLAAAVDALQDGFALYDAQDRLLMCNDRYRHMFPVSAHLIVAGARYEDILTFGVAHGEYRAASVAPAWLQDRMEAHRRVENQSEQQLCDGRWLRVHERETPDGGRVCLVVDITALKEAEARAVADRAAAMDASRDAMAISDPEGRFLYTNAAFLALVRSKGSLVGKPWPSVFCTEVTKSLEREAFVNLDKECGWQGEVAGHCADGTHIDLDVSLTRRPDGAVLWILRDLSERRRAEIERNRLREELQIAQRREVIGQLAAGLAHDFGNFVATISCSAALALSGSQSQAEAEEHILRISRAADQAEGMVRRILAIGGTRPTQPRVIDLRACLKEASDLLRPALPPNIRLVTAMPDTPLHVEADPTDILQIVLNLGLNARDAMATHPAPSGGHVLRLGLGSSFQAFDNEVYHAGPALFPGGAAVIEVTDTGRGLSGEAAERAFMPYSTSKGEKGSGLGLCIVQSIALDAKGAVSVLPEPSGGACFKVWLPLPSGQPNTPQASDQPKPMAAMPRLDGAAIVLADDDADTLAILSAMLERFGAEVAPSTDPSAVLEIVSEDPDAFDLLVTDFEMPGMTGADLARAVHLINPTLPVVLVTGLENWQRSDREGADDPRFSAVLRKPVTLRNLVGSVAAALKPGPAKE